MLKVRLNCSYVWAYMCCCRSSCQLDIRNKGNFDKQFICICFYMVIHKQPASQRKPKRHPIFCILIRTNELSGIGAVVKVFDSHLWGWGSIPDKSCSFLIVSLSKGLSLCFMSSDQHVKYWMPRGIPLTSSFELLLDYHVKQNTRTHARTH